jgi:hypothetical protein
VKINPRSAVGALCVVALGAFVADAFTTVALFVVLTPLALIVAGYFGMHALLLGAGEPRSRVSHVAIYTAALGTPLGTLAINIGAMFLAHAMTGPTFWVPLAAAAANVAFGMGILTLAGVLVEAFR